MKGFLAAALLLVALPASAQTVEVAEGKWSNLPYAKERGLGSISSTAVARIHEVIASGDCQVEGQSRRKLDMTVPFALLFSPEGDLQKVVLQRIGCPEVEGILGGTVLELVKLGKYAPTGENSAGWYRSEISFSSVS